MYIFSFKLIFKQLQIGR